MNEKNNTRGLSVKKAILNYVIRYIERHGYSPTVREIGDGVGLKSTSSVQNHLAAMFENGMLETDSGIGSPRAIRVPGYKFIKEETV